MKSPFRKTHSGFVLASALILLVSLTLVAVTVAYRNTLNEMMAANQRDYVNAMTVAESGIEEGFAKVKHNQGGFWVDMANQVFGQELLDVNNNTFTSGYVSGGNYLVTVRDQLDPGGNPVVIMNSLGAVNGAEREIEVVMEMRPYGTQQYAILTSDDINKISGNPVITGPYADIHTNSDLYISGDPIVAGSVSASGEILEGADSGGIDGEAIEGAPQVEIPYIYPPEYYQYRTIEFTADCRVLDANGTLLANAASGKWHGWDCSPGDKWTMSTSNAADMYPAFYYIRGNMIISGSPEDTWWYASFVAEGYIEVGGNPWLRPWGSHPDYDTGDPVANEILFYAGNDLKINGNADQQFFGILATHMEIDVSGNPFLMGTIVAENGAGQEVTSGQDVKNIVDKNSFSGNMHLEAAGSALFGGGKKLTVTAWRELVN
jgi:hypothetical protein